MTEQSPKKTARKGIQSIETGFRIIDFLVNAGRPMALKDISQGTGLSPSSLNFYLVSLVEIGVAIQDRNTGRYGLGPYTHKLGLAGLEQFDIFAMARDSMTDLANNIGHSVFLGVWGNHGPTIIYRADGQHSRAVFELRVGSVLPVLRSALGRLFLAYLPEGMTSMFVESELMDGSHLASSSRSLDVPRNRLETSELIASVHEHGMSRCRGALLSEYTAISAPIIDHAGSIIAGMTVMGQIGVLDDDFSGGAAKAVRELAQRLSQDAGQRSINSMLSASRSRKPKAE